MMWVVFFLAFGIIGHRPMTAEIMAIGRRHRIKVGHFGVAAILRDEIIARLDGDSAVLGLDAELSVCECRDTEQC